MIQHNDSDTSCMRAVMPAERTIASEAEHTPQQHPKGLLGRWLGLMRQSIPTSATITVTICINGTQYTPHSNPGSHLGAGQVHHQATAAITTVTMPQSLFYNIIMTSLLLKLAYTLILPPEIIWGLARSNIKSGCSSCYCNHPSAVPLATPKAHC